MYRQLIMDFLAERLSGIAALRVDYPEETPSSPVVTYTEAANNAYRTLDGAEFLTEYDPQLDVYADTVQQTDEIADVISAAMREMGFKRLFCNDAAPIDSGRHKQMRFHGLIGPGNVVYQS